MKFNQNWIVERLNLNSQSENWFSVSHWINSSTLKSVSLLSFRSKLELWTERSLLPDSAWPIKSRLIIWYKLYQSQKSFLVEEKNRNNFVLEEMKRKYDSLKELISNYKSNEMPMGSLQCESGFIESPLSEINCWFFSDCWVRPHTSNHLSLPSRDWPVFWIRNFVYFCWPIRRRKTKMIRRVGANPAIWISPFCRFRVIWLSMIKDSYGIRGGSNYKTKNCVHERGTQRMYYTWLNCSKIQL